MNGFNRILCALFDIICRPAASLGLWWGLVCLSAVTGILMLFVFRFTSNQSGIARVKNRIKAYLLEARLYNDDLGLMLQAQKSIFRQTVTYLRYSLVPLLFLLAPVVLIMIQLSLWFDRSPVWPGQPVLLKVVYADDAAFDPDARLEVPKGMTAETLPVRIPEKREVLWRLKGIEAGAYDVVVQSNGQALHKQIIVAENPARISVQRVSSGFFRRLLHPGEKSISSESGVDFIEVGYPAVSYTVMGWTMHWLVIFFVVSLAAGFLLKGLFGVEV